MEKINIKRLVCRDGTWFKKDVTIPYRPVTCEIIHKSKDGIIINGKREGFWKFYYERPNQIAAEVNFKNGKKHGLWKWYCFWTGIVDILSFYKDGKEHGVWKYFDENGLTEIVTYKDGKEISRQKSNLKIIK